MNVLPGGPGSVDHHEVPWFSLYPEACWKMKAFGSTAQHERLPDLGLSKIFDIVFAEVRRLQLLPTTASTRYIMPIFTMKAPTALIPSSASRNTAPTTASSNVA